MAFAPQLKFYLPVISLNDILAKKGLVILRTTIYLIRHGESEANERNAFLGHCDLNITEVGYKQACAVAEFLEREAGCPDVIYSSDLSRAFNTAK